MSYHTLSSGEPPAAPPLYDNIDDLSHEPTVNIEQFEFEDAIPVPELAATTATRGNNILRKSLNKLSSLRSSIIQPMQHMIDPIYEGYKYFHALYERQILKLGNPLVVKRLLYVLFIVSFIFVLTKHNPTGTGSGGSFALGSVFDLKELANSFEPYIDPKLMKEQLEYFLSMPHLAGTKGDLTLARYMETYMKNNGITQMDFNQVSSNANYPKRERDGNYVRLALAGWEAHLEESGASGINNYAYNPNAMNSDGEIKAAYLYAGYGSEVDFQILAKEADIKDLIVLVKYGGKGSQPELNKVKLAQDHGAAALIFVLEEFTVDGTVHNNAIQRINVGLERHSTGDVLTPGWSLGEGYVTRLPWFKSDCTAKIPTIPISAADGQYLIDKLNGKGARISEHEYLGDKSTELLSIKVTYEQRAVSQIWNVVGSIVGREQAAKGVIIGSSRDSLCIGTIQSGSGSTVLLELIKLFTSLQRKYNWSPARLIYFVLFDGSEYNMAGLTEWIESRRDLIEKEGYAYIDLSDLVSGDTLEIKSHPILQEVLKTALLDFKLKDNKSFLDLFYSQKLELGKKPQFSNEFLELKNYIPFINLLNIPSVEIRFTGQKYPKGSCLDNFKHFELSGIDPSMDKHKTIVEAIARVTLYLAEMPFVPYNFEVFSHSLLDYLQDLENFAKETAASHKTTGSTSLRFDGLSSAIKELMSSLKSLNDWINQWQLMIGNVGGGEPSYMAMNRWQQNNHFVEFNSLFVTKDLKPRRPGYLNLLFGVPFYAPAKTGDVDDPHQWNTFPTIRDYIMEGNWNNAQRDIDHLAVVFLSAAKRMVASKK